MTEVKNDHQILILSNGLKIGNFSSPHPFTFTDGCTLPAVNNYISTLLSMNAEEKLHPRNRHNIEYCDIEITFTLTKPVRHELDEWQKEWEKNIVDIVIVPRPLLDALHKAHLFVYSTPFRTIRMANRITKTCHINKFCV